MAISSDSTLWLIALTRYGRQMPIINRALSLGSAEPSRLPFDNWGGERRAREQALYGCYLAGVAFASAGSGLHHKICHVLGGTFNLPHAETHSVVLRYVAALNLPAVPETAKALAIALEGEDAINALNQLYHGVGAPKSLAELGMPEKGIAEAVERVLAAVPRGNPVKVTKEPHRFA